MRRAFRPLGGIAALTASLAALISVPAAAGPPRHVVPRAGFFAGASPNQLLVAASQKQLRFITVAIASPRRCSGRVYAQFVSVSRTGSFRGRGLFNRTTHETFSGRFLTGSHAEGNVTRVEYAAPGRSVCRASAHFDFRWWRPV